MGDAADFDRKAVIAAAVEARGRGDRKKALALFRAALTHAPDDHEVHGKLAPLLAESGDVDAAAASFRAGAEGYHQRGFTDRALALLKQSVAHAPHDAEAWLRMAELYVVREKPADADKALADARPHFVSRRALPDAARILDARLALRRAPVDVAVDRARVAKRLGRKSFGLLLLTDLLDGVDAKARRRLRRALFSLSPTPASLWRWLRNAPA